MSDQCHSTKGRMTPPRARELSRVGGTGQKLWRSVEEVADTPDFREFLEREFPAGASTLLETSRRDFMKIMGAGLALAGAATIPGCRRPDHKILAYSRDVPEMAIPGKPLFYATSLPIPGGGAEGVVVETHEFRPTKVEGNPLHPINQGKSSVWAQASVMGLYDPERLKHPIFVENGEAKAATWDDFKYWWNQQGLTDQFDATGGRGLAILTNKKSSPSREAVRDALKRKYANAIWAVYEPSESGTVGAGCALAFGAPRREVLSLAKASTIVSIDRDFLNTSSANEPRAMAHARDFASTRRPMRPGDPMSRLYMAETGFSITGSCADHRMALAPSRLVAFAVLLGREVLRLTGGAADLLRAIEAVDVPAGDDLDRRMIEVAAKDLVEHRAGSLVVAGPSLPAEAHALVHAMNRALGAVGTTVSYLPVPDADESAAPLSGLEAVSRAIDAGQVDTLICIDVNPVYDAPGEMEFAAKFSRVRRTITLAVGASETASASMWQLNGTHPLESWGDTRSADGTIAPIQPMIAPLYEPAMSEIEFVAWLSGDPRFFETPAADAHATNGHGPSPHVSGHAIVRETWKNAGVITGDFEKGWRRALHDGLAHGSTATPGEGAPAATVLANATQAVSRLRVGAAPEQDSLDVSFRCSHVGDGRFANVSWLQEFPDTGTRVVWDNPALVSPATAKAMGVMPEPYIEKEPKARVVTVTVDGRSVEIPVWILPGMADNCVLLTLGYGRTVCGAVGDNIGFDVGAVRPRSGAMTLRGGRISKTPRRYFIASTQVHWSMEGRDSIVRQLDKKWFDAHAGHGPTIKADEIYGRFESELTLGERLGELSHTPPNVGAYPNPFNAGAADPDTSKRVTDRLGRQTPPIYAERPQWGMSIDLSSCTGCGACTIACQAENNIPNVGKKETAKGREMAWIRVDRYFTGDDWRRPESMLHQPVACVHCENAPCETVCPVNATSHDREGLNVMAYNRCIGTRYCANNCPYKVRRFNFFEYGPKKFNGGFVGEQAIGARPDNVNLIPPRLREQLDEISRLRMNPDVTIRSRGVMEKCSYCVQRINAARFEMKIKDMAEIPDGFVQSACQQACPSSAIEFGDLLDPHSRVRQHRENDRSYLLLGFLNTRPRTTHMLRVANPHPDLVSQERRDHDPLAAHGGGREESEPEGGGHSFFDPRQARDDAGYAMSLRVLTGALA
ncbi:MAG: TAT-variant-translocated molybdopterin oxidoreductase [Phycisphaeraceae bacterium]|nr:TAT-variant-translocated molybdopterin oxidoreductase [Phycisphaeraceae bacterium]